MASIMTALTDPQCVSVERMEDENDPTIVSYSCSFEAMSSEDVLGFSIQIPAEVVDKYDFHMYDGRTLLDHVRAIAQA